MRRFRRPGWCADPVSLRGFMQQPPRGVIILVGRLRHRGILPKPRASLGHPFCSRPRLISTILGLPGTSRRRLVGRWRRVGRPSGVRGRRRVGRPLRVRRRTRLRDGRRRRLLRGRDGRGLFRSCRGARIENRRGGRGIGDGGRRGLGRLWHLECAIVGSRAGGKHARVYPLVPRVTQPTRAVSGRRPGVASH
jgi:hypothetical protein